LNDKEVVPGKNATPTNVLAKQGVTAVGCLAGGAALLIVGALPSIIGIVAGAVIGIIGVSALMSKDPGDKMPGTILTAAGALKIVSRVGLAAIRPLAGTLLGISAVGLLVLGVLNGVKFLKGLKSRS
jgi:hypothetical protein